MSTTPMRRIGFGMRRSGTGRFGMGRFGMGRFGIGRGPLGGALAVLFLLTLGGAATAGAQDADALLARGVEARRSGNDEAALEFFTQANTARPSGVARAQMGLAAQALGRWVPAYDHLRAALATDDEFVARNRTTLEGALETVQTHVGRLELRSAASGASVQINGRDVGTLPLPGPITVPIGETVITVRQEGFHRFNRTVQITGGVIFREQVTLVAIEAEPVTAPVAQQPPPPVEPDPNAAVGPQAQYDPRYDEPQYVERPQVVVRGGSGRGALIGMGVTFTVFAVLGISIGAGFADAFVQMDSFWGSSACQQGPQPERVCPDTLAARNLNEGGMIGGFVAGGGSLALAILFYGLFAATGPRYEEVGVACGGGPGDLGVACTAAF